MTDLPEVRRLLEAKRNLEYRARELKSHAVFKESLKESYHDRNRRKHENAAKDARQFAADIEALLSAAEAGEKMREVLAQVYEADQDYPFLPLSLVVQIRATLAGTGEACGREQSSLGAP